MAKYDEGCCFNYLRDHCPGQGCPCGCHAKGPTDSAHNVTVRALLSTYVAEHDALRALADAVGAYLDAADALDTEQIEQTFEAMRLLHRAAEKVRAT